MVDTDIYINLANNMETEKEGPQTLSGVKIRIDYNELDKNQIIASCTICKMDQIELLCMKN